MKQMLYSGCAVAAAAAFASPAVAGQKDDGGANGPDVAAQIKELGEAISGKIDKLKEDQDRLKNETGEADRKFTDLKSQVDERLTELTGLKDSMQKLEQNAARGSGAPTVKKSAGQTFVEQDGLKSLKDQSTAGRFAMEYQGSLGVKDISSVNDPAGTPGSAGALIEPDRRGLVEIQRRRMTIRSLLTVGQTNSPLIEYEQMTADTNAADGVAEGAALPQTELTFEDKTAKVIDIGHFIRANRNILDDAPRLASMIDGRLRYGLAYKEELQILLGSGTGNNMEGLVTAASAYAPPASVVSAVTQRTRLDVLRLALLQTIVDEYAPNGIVLNHLDWAVIELTKDSEGRYIIGQPQTQIGATMWGQPVVATNAMTPDNFLTGDFALGAELLDRQTASVEASTEDGDNFRTRKVTVTGFQRAALPIYRPDAFVTGDFTSALA